MIRATEQYVRVIVRRPHAYRFLQDYLPELERLTRAPEVPEGEPEPILLLQRPGDTPLSGPITMPDGTIVDASEIVTIDASKIPIPGFIVLEANGTVRGNLSFLEGGDRDEMLDFLKSHAKSDRNRSPLGAVIR